MTGQKAMRLVEKAKISLETGMGEIKLDGDKSIFDCDRDKRDQKYIFSIGTYEFIESPDKEFSTSDAMHPIVGMFHEVCGHGGQLTYEFDKDTSLSKVIALNHYACNGSAAYYGFEDGLPNDQYFRQPHEIAAQYAGIYCAYQFLCSEFDSDDANTMICEYVNDRIKNRSEFISGNKTYTDVKDVLKDLNHTFQKSISHHRDYKHKESDILNTYPKAIHPVEKQRNGLKQDYMMSAVYMRYYDRTRMIQTKPVFSGVDLSVEAAFQRFREPIKPRPKPKQLRLEDLTNAVKPDLTLSEQDLDFAAEHERGL